MTRNRRVPFGDLWQEMNRMQDEFNRLFGRLSPVARADGAAVAGPAVNVWEDETALFAEADLPGIDPAKLEVFVTEGNQLTVQGERAAPEVPGAAWVRQERPSGPFVRVIALPALVDADKVDARYEHGVLRVTLPKSEAAKPRKINVTVVE